MSYQKTTVTQQKEHKFDILAVSRLIKGTIFREKTEIINPWGVRRPPSLPLNDAPDSTRGHWYSTYRKTANRSPRPLLEHLTQTPGLYWRTGFYLRPGFH